MGLKSRNGERAAIAIGDKFGLLEVVGPESILMCKTRTQPFLPVKCRCGTQRLVRVYSLLNSKGARSCGCETVRKTRERATSHGESRTKLHQHWIWMRTRATNPNRQQAKDYVDRGITCCPAWEKYENFRDWARSNGYEEGLTLERRDVDGPYSPDNCTWITSAEQQLNKRNSLKVTAFGETKVVSEWAKDPRCLVRWRCLYKRIHDGWPPEQAIIRPPSPGHAPVF